MLAVDASEWGLGVTTSHISPHKTQQLGGFSERWRFRDEDARNPSQFVVTEEEKNEIGHFRIEENNPGNVEGSQLVECNSCPRSFKTVGFEVVDRSWQVVGRYRWQRRESMPVYEARASLHAIQHHLRSLRSFGQKHIILTDSMTAAVAFDKGRAQGFSLRRVVQQTAALSMASGCLFRMRWIPSEWNPADGPSRGGWEPSIPSRVLKDDSSATWGSSDMAVQEGKAANNRGFAKGGPDRGDASDMGHRVGETEKKPEEKKKARRSQRRRNASVINPVSLKEASVKTATRLRYQMQWTNFEKWGKRRVKQILTLGLEEPSKAAARMDSLVVDYLEFLYISGEDLSVANYTMASIVFKIPWLKNQAALPEALQSMKGWRRLCPPRSRMPLPYEAVCLVVRRAVQEEEQEIGLVLLLSYYLYLRPMEAFRLRVKDIVKPVRGGGSGYGHYSFLLHPMEQGVPSKTLQWDEALVLDLSHQKFLGPALNKWLKLGQRKKDSLAFSVTPDKVNNFMARVWSPLGLQSLGHPHLYRLRHGGASHDAMRQYRSLPAIQSRGRWQSVKSVRNYEKGSRLAQLFGSLEESVQQKAIEAAKSVSRLF